MKQKLLLLRNEINSLLMMIFSFALLCVMQSTFAQTITSYQTGTHDGFYYSFWTEGGGTASMTLGPKGNYSTKWTNIQNFTAGKGWAVGKRDRVVCYEGTYDGGSNGFLAVYGWTKNDLIEYYVVESHGQWKPPGNTSDIETFGTVESDGGTYDIYRSKRTNKPSIVGNATFYQFWSVRRTKRTSGTVTFANHVNAWEKTGLKLGSTWDYQIMESEGYGSSGSSNITMWECSSCATEAPKVTGTITYEVGDVASTLTATGTGLKWYTTASGGAGSNNAPKPTTATAGTTTYYVSATANGCESSRSAITVNVVNTYKIYKASSPIIIDGEVDEKWSDAKIAPMNATKVLVGTVSSPADLSGYGKLLWDNNYVYLLAVVTDDVQKNDSENSYEDDAVEFYFDINNDKATTYGENDVQYSFGWNDGTIVGSLPAGRAVTGIEYVSVTTDNGYIIEGRIPWSTLKGSPVGGQLIGIDFMINDDDTGAERDKKLSWNAATDNAWENPSLFGTGKLIAEEIITSIDKNQTYTVSVYPNPAKETILVKGFEGEFNYVIYDNTGRSLQTGSSQGTIQLQSIQKGIYFLDVMQNDKKNLLKIIVE